MTISLPARTRRLFAHYEAASLVDGSCVALVVARVLEEGDSEDLRWLTVAVDENELIAWLSDRGDRQLSRRSLAFWLWLLVPDHTDSAFPESVLWPL